LPAIVGPIVVQSPWTVEARTCTPMFTVKRARLRAELRGSGETAE
jgi:hypothetical protein